MSGGRIYPSRLAIRLMAFLTGINEERPTRARIAHALKRSTRSVEVAIAQLIKIQWITCAGGGNGTPSKIIVINAIDWKTAGDSKSANLLAKPVGDSQKTAGDQARIRVKVKPLEQAPTESRSEILTLVENTFGTHQLGGYVTERGERLRAGVLPDAGTLLRIAQALAIVEQQPQLWHEFIRLAREAIRQANDWGLIVHIAREVGGVQRKPMGKESGLVKQRRGAVKQ